MTAHPTMTAGSPVARGLPEICAAARQTRCGHCWASPGMPCSTSPEGDHVARFYRAFRRGLISGPELITALQDADVFTAVTVISAGPRQGCRVNVGTGELATLCDDVAVLAQEVRLLRRELTVAETTRFVAGQRFTPTPRPGRLQVVAGTGGLR